MSSLYRQATPALEASDEACHFGFVLHLLETGALPVADPKQPTRVGQEATQPPLYYLTAAALVRSADRSDADAFYVHRVGSPIGRADIPGPKNMFVHGAERSREVGGTLRAIETLRRYSMALGSGTIALTYLLALGFFPHEPWRCGFAAVLVGLNPMFLFVSNSVNNDNLVILLVTAFVLVLVALHRVPYRAWHAALLGALAGVATLAKASGLITLPAIAISIGLRVEDRRLRWMALAACLGAWVSLCGWWLLRNLLVYGEFLASSAHTALAQNDRRHWKPLVLMVEWDGFLKSYWGVFGAFNVIYPDPVYTAFYGLTLLGFGSLALWWWRSRAGVRFDVVLLALCVALNLLAVAWWTSHLKGSQGRLMFPTLAAATVLYAVGLDAWGRRLRGVLAAAISLLLLGFALYGALDVIPRQYPGPQASRSGSLRSDHVCTSSPETLALATTREPCPS